MNILYIGIGNTQIYIRFVSLILLSLSNIFKSSYNRYKKLELILYHLYLIYIFKSLILILPSSLLLVVLLLLLFFEARRIELDWIGFIVAWIETNSFSLAFVLIWIQIFLLLLLFWKGRLKSNKINYDNSFFTSLGEKERIYQVILVKNR